MPHSGKLTYALEDWPRYYADPAREALWRDHYAAAPLDHALLPYQPDPHYFASLASVGQLQVLTARCNGAMVGYVLSAIRRHAEHGLLCCFVQSYYMTPAWSASAMFRATFAAAAARGAKLAFVPSWSRPRVCSLRIVPLHRSH
jgi:hypothetical protein